MPCHVSVVMVPEAALTIPPQQLAQAETNCALSARDAGPRRTPELSAAVEFVHTAIPTFQLYFRMRNCPSSNQIKSAADLLIVRRLLAIMRDEYRAGTSALS